MRYLRDDNNSLHNIAIMSLLSFVYFLNFNIILRLTRNRPPNTNYDYIHALPEGGQ